MAPVLTIYDVATTAGFSLATHLRLQPGEGFDPADNDFLQPQFGDAASGEGDPLISLGERNRELAFPLTLNPAKAGYADSKDGLHQLVRDIQRRLGEISVLEWRDDAATRSSYMNVEGARLELAYDYRRAQYKWVQAVLRVWTRPYAHTGTYTMLGTSAASSVPVSTHMQATGRDGDVPADPIVTVGWNAAGAATVYPASGALFAGYSAVDMYMPPIITTSVFSPAASLSKVIGTLTGASGAVASQMVTVNAGASAGGMLDITGMDLQNVRIVALARNRAATTAVIFARDVLAINQDAAALIGPTQALAAGRQWRVVDLGVNRLGPVAIQFPRIYAGVLGSPATGLVDFGGVFALPEDRTVAVFGPADTRTGGAAATHVFTATTSSRVQGTPTAPGLTLDMDAYQRGLPPKIDVHQPTLAVPGNPSGFPSIVQRTTGVFAFAVPDDGPQNGSVTVSVQIREKFTYHR